MTDLKIPVALVFAIVAQTVGAVWWISDQAHQIEALKTELTAVHDAVIQLELDADDLIQFATYTENKWAEGYDEDPSYIRIFGTK
jgi:hypothetical protein